MFQQLTVKSARVKTTGLNCKNGWSIFLWTDKVKLMMHLPFSVYITNEILTKSLFFSMRHTFLVDFLSQSWQIVLMASPILALSHRNWCSEFVLVFSSLRVREQETRPFFASTTCKFKSSGEHLWEYAHTINHVYQVKAVLKENHFRAAILYRVVCAPLPIQAGAHCWKRPWSSSVKPWPFSVAGALALPFTLSFLLLFEGISHRLFLKLPIYPGPSWGWGHVLLFCSLTATPVLSAAHWPWI